MLLLPLSSFWVIREEDYTPNDSRTKIRDRTPMSPGDTMKYENGTRVAEIYKATHTPLKTHTTCKGARWIRGETGWALAQP